jgi:prevent-host-death family protein
VAKTVNIHEAKIHLSELVAKVESGEEIIIARSGKPVARLCALASKKEKKSTRKPGFAKGLIPSPEALFDPALDREIEALFYSDSHDELNALLKVRRPICSFA